MTYLQNLKKKFQVTALRLGTTKEEILEELARHHFASLGVSSKGNIWLLTKKYPDDERITDRISADQKKKFVYFYRLSPGAQKLTKFLIQHGIIDKSWSIQPALSPTGYKNQGYKNEKDFDFFLDPRNTLTRSFNGKVKFYHGTSSEDWDKIRKVGLVPLKHGPNKNWGFESREKHEGNEKVLYLTDSLMVAVDYGKQRCSSLGILAKREGKRVRDDYYGDGVWVENNHISVIALEVSIPDVTRLVADDDHVNYKARELAREIWNKKPSDEKQKILEDLKKLRTDLSTDYSGWRDPSTQVCIWRETDQGFNEIMSHMPKAIFKEWFESLRNHDQVGYRGIISPKFLRVVEADYLEKTS